MADGLGIYISTYLKEQQMLENGLNYDKTVKTKRLVFKGQEQEKIFSYFFQFITIALGSIVSFFIFKDQISTSDPSLIDYFVAFLFPIIIMLLIILGCNNLLNRDKLKEIQTNSDIESARIKLIEAAKTLNWRSIAITDNYIIFVTKFGFIKDSQTVTLIFFPEKKIYFNSLNYPSDYIRPARFEENYKALMSEYHK